MSILDQLRFAAAVTVIPVVETVASGVDGDGDSNGISYSNFGNVA